MLRNVDEIMEPTLAVLTPKKKGNINGHTI